MLPHSTCRQAHGQGDGSAGHLLNPVKSASHTLDHHRATRRTGSSSPQVCALLLPCVHSDTTKTHAQSGLSSSCRCFCCNVAGQSVYVFKPSDSANSLSVSVMEAPDSPAVSMAQAAAQAATEQALLVGTAAATPTTNNLPPPPSVVDSSATSNVVRAENKFSLEDHFFRVSKLLLSRTTVL